MCPSQARDETTVITGPEPGESTASQRWLLISMSGNSLGQIFPLDPTRPLILIGREESSDVQVLDAEISRRHAAIRYESSNRLVLVDLESRNGTAVNGVRVDKEARLRVGDKIQLGTSTIMRLSLSDEPEAIYAMRMYQQALRDGLTGAFNRRYFDERVITELAYARRHHDPLALLLVDLDHFKIVNDEHGHLAGDTVLQRFVQLVQAEVRTEDVVARYGGEEFAVLCRDTSMDEALILAERLRRAVAEADIRYEGGPIPVTVSIGISNSSIRRTAADLIAFADKALYAAKQAGRNRCVSDE